MRTAAALLSVIICLSTAHPCRAQETTGGLEGAVVDAGGHPVAGAQILLEGPSALGNRVLFSDPKGRFAAHNLPLGYYTVVVTHTSYDGVKHERVHVSLGKTTYLGETRLGTPGDRVETVIVTAKAPMIDVSSTSLGANLSSEEFENLPLDRDYMSIPTLLPQVNESYLGDRINFAGSTGLENRYFIDGVETTDPLVGAMGAFIPQNFVKEIQVRTGGYEAEYRGSLGGIINAVSRSGGDEFHGQVFGFFLNNSLVGNSRRSFNQPVTGEYAQYDLGFSLSGPLKRERAWFFAAYNPQVRKEDVEIPGLGYFEDNGVAHAFSGRLDLKAGPGTRITLTAVGDPTTRDQITDPLTASYANPDPALAKSTSGGVNLLANVTHFLSEDMYLEASVSEVRRRSSVEAATKVGESEVCVVDLESGVTSGGRDGVSKSDMSQLTAEVKATWELQDHRLKSGLAYREKSVEFEERWRVFNRFDDTTWQESDWLVTPSTIKNRIPSFFVQDAWRISDRLLINAGVRWDGQFLIDSEGAVGQKITDQIQPRLGVVFRPGKSGSQKVFGSFGRYYQDLALYMSVYAHNASSRWRVVEYDHDPRQDPSGGTVIAEDLGHVHPEVRGLKGQHFDEFNLGYQRQVGKRLTAGAVGTYRVLRQAVEDAYVSDLGEWRIGNPGEGLLAEYPHARREYTGLEILCQFRGGQKFQARASYVLSRSEGNYPGIFDSEYFNYSGANYNASFDLPEMLDNADGLLPNDRTHVFKLSGAYLFDFGLSAGTFFTWQTGTPLSVLDGACGPGESCLGYPFLNFAQKRGSAGRTPSLWDLSLRFTYDLSRAVRIGNRPRLILDVFHLGSEREPVEFDEVRYFNRNPDGTPVDLNPTYGLPVAFQPPTTVRLGVEIDL